MEAGLWQSKQFPSSLGKILDRLSAVIDGTVILDNDSFCVLKKDDRKIDFSLEEGLRKLGLLWKLIRNGLLEKGVGQAIVATVAVVLCKVMDNK